MVSFPETASEQQQMQMRSHRAPNIANAERIALGALGAALAARALSHPTLPRLLLGAIGGGLLYRSSTGYCPAYSRLGIDMARKGAARPQDYFKNGIHVEMNYTVRRPVQELYNYWRNFENLPRFMYHLQGVQKIDERRSRWVAKGPAGRSVAWDAEIINEEPGRLIAWRSLANSDVDNAGSVWFVPTLNGAEVRVVIEYIPPAGKIGQAIAWMFGEEPRQQIEEDLRRFKRLMETTVSPTGV